jgi:hypothetical protein
MYVCVLLCIVCFVTFPVLFVCICVLKYCYRVGTQLQLNISYQICFKSLSLLRRKFIQETQFQRCLSIGQPERDKLLPCIFCSLGEEKGKVLRMFEIHYIIYVLLGHGIAQKSCLICLVVNIRPDAHLC